MNISNQTIEKIKKQIDIKEVIGYYTKVKNNKAVCPLHDDQDPSLEIYPETNSWYCFGCNEGGDIIEFIRLVEGISFVTAVEKLAEENNFDVDYDPSRIKTSDFIKVIEELSEMEHDKIFGEQLLKKYKYKHEYLFDMGFDEDIIDFFELGYCFDVNDDLFNRITIAWRNSKGELVGIFGRDVTNKDDNKYKAKYGSKKGKHLYNLNNAKDYDEIIVVEDEKSVWRLHQFGFPNAIALGNCQLKNRKWLLRSYTDHIILCLDNDKVGKEARNKIIQEVYYLFDIEVIKLPDGYKDVAEIKEKEVFDKSYKKRIPVYY